MPNPGGALQCLVSCNVTKTSICSSFGIFESRCPCAARPACSLSDTEIPALRGHVRLVAERGRQATLQRMAHNLSAFISSAGHALVAQVRAHAAMTHHESSRMAHVPPCVVVW